MTIAQRVGVNILCPRACDVTAELVRRFHAAGYPVRAWGIRGRDEVQMERLIRCGVDGMTTDYPDALVRLHKRTE